MRLSQPGRAVIAGSCSRLLLTLVSLLPVACAQQFTFTSYEEGSGLSNLNATTLLQDHAGVVWTATENGIFTADGDRFTKQEVFSKAGFDSARILREDPSGRVWALDGHHLGFWKNGVVRTIEQLNFHVLSHETLDLLVMAEMRDAVYLLKDGQLLLISSADHGASWHVSEALTQPILATNPKLKALTAVTSGGGSKIWVGCGQSICQIDLKHGSVTEYGKRQGVKPTTWQTLLLTRSGALWARGERNVAMLAPSERIFHPVTGLPESSHANLRKRMLLEDSRGQVILNLPKGIAVREIAGWRFYDQRNGLPEDEIDTLMFDHAGALWLTSLGHGILRWRGYGIWEGWNRTGGLSSSIVWSLGRGSGGLWAATDHGINLLDSLSKQVVHHQGSDQRLLSVVVDHRNHGWVANAQGQVFEIDPNTWRSRLVAENLDRVFQLLIDREQRIWICSRKGLLYFSGSDDWSKPHLVHEARGPSDYAWSIAEGAGGTLWVTNRKGLYRLSGNSWTIIRLPFPEGIEYNRMLTVAPDGTLWLQSKLPYPLLHLEIKGEEAHVIGQVSGFSIPSDNTTFIESDVRGWIWVGSDEGICVFNGLSWLQLSAEDGLLWNDTDFHGYLADYDGSIWVGTSAGISHILHPESIFELQPPVARLAELNISGRDIPNDAPEFNLRKPVLSFRFQNLNYDRGSAVAARYRIDGEDNDWQDASGATIRVPALDAGKYRLRMLAYDKRAHTQSPEIDVGFTVLEPWWKRRGFVMVEAVGLAIIVLVIWRLSIRLLVARQHELERMVTSRTKELEDEKSELLHARSALLEVTRRDALTGLLNRGAIFERLSTLCEARRAGGSPVAVIMADLDCFKRVNDNHGHLVGDSVLKECAARIGFVTCPKDAVGRYGGEELLILMPGLTPSGLRARMEELRIAIAGEPIRRADVVLNISCSFGVAWFDGEDCNIERLISLADTALYLAKKNGRNRVEYANPVFAFG